MKKITITLMLATTICFMKSCVPAGAWLRKNLELNVQPDTLLISNNQVSYEILFSGNSQVLTLVDSIVVILTEKETGSKMGTAIFYGKPELLGEPPMAFELKKEMQVPWRPDIQGRVDAEITLMRGKKSKKLRYKEVVVIMKE